MKIGETAIPPSRSLTPEPAPDAQAIERADQITERARDEATHQIASALARFETPERAMSRASQLMRCIEPPEEPTPEKPHVKDFVSFVLSGIEQPSDLFDLIPKEVAHDIFETLNGYSRVAFGQGIQEVEFSGWKVSEMLTAPNSDSLLEGLGALDELNTLHITPAPHVAESVWDLTRLMAVRGQFPMIEIECNEGRCVKEIHVPEGALLAGFSSEPLKQEVKVFHRSPGRPPRQSLLQGSILYDRAAFDFGWQPLAMHKWFRFFPAVQEGCLPTADQMHGFVRGLVAENCAPQMILTDANKALVIAAWFRGPFDNPRAQEALARMVLESSDEATTKGPRIVEMHVLGAMACAILDHGRDAAQKSLLLRSLGTSPTELIQNLVETNVDSDLAMARSVIASLRSLGDAPLMESIAAQYPQLMPAANA